MIFDDPFSLDFLSSTTNIREQSLALLKPVKPIKATLVKEPMTKFYMHKNLKDRLLRLIETYNHLGEESPIVQIASALLAINKVPVNQINYLGLSQEDFTKISYLVPERVERAKSRKYIEAYVTRKTKVIIQSIVQTAIPVKNNSDLIEDADKQIQKTYHERVVNFSDETFEEYNEEIPLVRKKIYNHDEKDNFGAPTYTESFVLPIGTFTFKETPYYHIIDNKLEVISSFTGGRELVDYWLTNVKFVHLLGCWDPSLRHHQSIHKVLNRIFGDKFTEREKNLFSEAYFKLVIPTDPSITFSIISKEMSEGYYYDNYFRPENDSPLWKSCMRHAECVDREYFALYEEIPECKLAILKKDEKVVARCLLWELDTKYYDRIYYYNDTYLAQLEKILRNLGYTFLRHTHSAGTTNTNVSFEVDSNLIRDISHFPYIDSFRFYILDKELLTTEEPDYGVYYKFDDTDGSFEVIGEEEDFLEPESLYCSCCEDMISENGDTEAPGVYFVGRGPEAGAYCCESCVNYSETYDTYILVSASTYCGFEQTYILDDDFVGLYNGEKCYKNHSRLRETEDGYYFVLGTELAELFVEIDDKWYLKENLAEQQEDSDTLDIESLELPESPESSELPPHIASIEIPEAPIPPNIDLF